MSYIDTEQYYTKYDFIQILPRLILILIWGLYKKRISYGHTLLARCNTYGIYIFKLCIMEYNCDFGSDILYANEYREIHYLQR